MIKQSSTENNDSESNSRFIPASGVARQLSDFTTSSSVLKLIPISVIIGIIGALVALFLLDLIALISNFLYYQRFDLNLTSPRNNMLWKLFMSCPEIQQGLKKLGFQSPYLD